MVNAGGKVAIALEVCLRPPLLFWLKGRKRVEISRQQTNMAETRTFISY
jgi:hypothetical protein